MRSLTLSQSLSPCLRPPRSPSSRLYSNSSLAPELERRRSGPVLPRYKRQLFGNRSQRLPGRVKPAVDEMQGALEHKWFDMKSLNRTTEIQDSLKFWISAVRSTTTDDSLANTYSNKLLTDASFADSLKFIILSGLLALQRCEPAVAVSDIASGLQSFPIFGDLGGISTGFASAFLLIFFSELGDKTFFIAALLAARNSAAIVFVGTFGALAAMTIVSVILGRTFHYVDMILPFGFGGTDLPIDDIAAVCLLIYFGITTLLDATSDDSQKAEDEQKEAELAVSEFSGNGSGISASANTIISTFALVFVAEWGDKSFFSTIALAAASSPLGVIGGALAGHGVATLLAVLGGSLLGTFLSEKAIAYIGGVLFLVFAAITLIDIIS